MFNDVIPKNMGPAFPEPVRGANVRPKLLEFLGLDKLPGPSDVDFTVRETGVDEDGMRRTALTYRNSLGEGVPGVVCIPGTGGSAEEVADPRFEPTPPDGQVRGFGRELARRGYATMSISIKGCYGRPRFPGRSEQENKYLVVYGRPPMGIKVEETLRAAVSLHFAYYNLVRGHGTLHGATPAMAAGVQDDFWTIRDLVELSN